MNEKEKLRKCSSLKTARIGQLNTLRDLGLDLTLEDKYYIIGTIGKIGIKAIKFIQNVRLTLN